MFTRVLLYHVVCILVDVLALLFHPVNPAHNEACSSHVLGKVTDSSTEKLTLHNPYSKSSQLFLKPRLSICGRGTSF